MKLNSVGPWLLIVGLPIGLLFYAKARANVASTSGSDLNVAASSLDKNLAKFRSLGLPWPSDPPVCDIHFKDDGDPSLYLRSAEIDLTELESEFKASHSIVQSQVSPARMGIQPNTDLSSWRYAKSNFEPIVNLALAASDLSPTSETEDCSPSEPALSQSTDVVRLLIYKAERAAELGDVGKTNRFLSASQRLIQMMLRYPDSFVPAEVMRDECLLCSAYENCTNDFFPAPQKLLEFFDNFQLAPLQIDLKNSLQAEIRSEIDQCRLEDPNPSSPSLGHSSTKGMIKNANSSLEPDGTPRDTRARAMTARCLEFWSKAYGDAIGQRDIDESVKVLDQDERVYMQTPGDTFSFASSLLPKFDRLESELTRSNSRIQAERLLTEALRVRLKTHRWPDFNSAPFAHAKALTGEEFKYLFVEMPMVSPGNPANRITVINGTTVYGSQFGSPSLRIYTPSGPQTNNTENYVRSMMPGNPPDRWMIAAFFPPPQLMHPDFPF